MNRRRFLLGRLNDDANGPPAPLLSASSDLTPYTPTPDKPWNAARAAHLMRRTGFGVTQAELTSALASDPATLVDAMLQPYTNPTLFWSWTQQPPLDPTAYTQEERNQIYSTWIRDVQFWWIGMMMTAGVKLREKMTLFWHGHFVSEFPKVEVAQYMYDQNRLLRQFAFGSYKDLTKQITINPAMLIYLDGNGSAKGSPNENYARELMELFTLGTGHYANNTPHYTEQDVIEMARALTGWDVNGREASFTLDKFDDGDKTLFGQTGNFGIEGYGEHDALELIFAQTDADYNIARPAIFLCSKLYQFFVYEVPNMDIVQGMAATLVANNWNVGPVLRQLFLSEHFFDDQVIGAMIKSPVDLVMGAMNAFSLKITINVDPGDPESHDPVRAMTFLSQTILYPPNVKGWPGGKSWISTATLPMRIRYLKLWIDPPDLPTTAPYGFEPTTFIKSLPDPGDVHKVVDALVTLLLPVPISDNAKSVILTTLLGGAPDYEWDPDQFEQKIRAGIIKITSLAEYQCM
ncbi:MAG: DUF1800 domain-containing protein [Bacteroidetes bacterium]|nr:DUF1800 domain-containing protein [Bacteroidota bacterium]